MKGSYCHIRPGSVPKISAPHQWKVTTFPVVDLACQSFNSVLPKLLQPTQMYIDLLLWEEIFVIASKFQLGLKQAFKCYRNHPYLERKALQPSGEQAKMYGSIFSERNRSRECFRLPDPVRLSAGRCAVPGHRHSSTVNRVNCESGRPANYRPAQKSIRSR